MKRVPAFVVTCSAALFLAAQTLDIPGNGRNLSLEQRCEPIQLPNGDRASHSGMATQGGYRFNFESVRGTNCRDYLLWNAPGQASVKVKWQYGADTTEPILAEARLASCSAGSDCKPIRFPKDDPPLVELRNTQLGYGGPNADTETEHPNAYVSSRENSAQTPMRSIIDGVVGDSDGRPVEVAVEVTSAVFGKEPPYSLEYTIRTGPKTPLNLWLPDEKRDRSQLQIRWETVESSQFFEDVRKQGFRLSGDHSTVKIEIPAKAFHQSSKLLIIMQGDDRLAAVSAPAYVASE